jgi:hypothetical protein
LAKTVAQLTERLLPEKKSANKSRPTKKCAVCYKQNKRRDIALWALTVRLVSAQRDASRHNIQRSTKAKSANF